MSPYIAQYYLISPNVSGLISPNVTLYRPMSPYITQCYLIFCPILPYILPNITLYSPILPYITQRCRISPNVTLYCPILLYTAQCHPIFKKILKTIPNIALSLPKSPYEVPNFFTATLGPMTILNIKKY